MKKTTKRSQEVKDGEEDGKKVEEVQVHKTQFIETMEATEAFRKTDHEGTLHLDNEEVLGGAVPIANISPVIITEIGKSLSGGVQITSAPPAKKKQKIVLSHLLNDD